MKIACKQMFLRVALTGIGILFLAGSSVFGQERYSFNRKVVNWGLKAGFNATAIMHLQVMQNDEELQGVAFRNRTGCEAFGFFRINLDRFFIQPELGWTLLNKDILFSIPENDALQLIELSIRTQSVNANGLIGYNITKTGPFVFNVLAGTSLRYRFNTFLETENGNYSIHPSRYNEPIYEIYGLVGFSMNISNIHFDIRYAINVLPTDIHFDEWSNSPDGLKGIAIRKRENALSFSCGVMF